jgi:hypothetical protein
MIHGDVREVSKKKQQAKIPRKKYLNTTALQRH